MPVDGFLVSLATQASVDSDERFELVVDLAIPAFKIRVNWYLIGVNPCLNSCPVLKFSSSI